MPPASRESFDRYRQPFHSSGPLALRAVELAPTNPFAHLYLARRYLYQMADPERALASLAEHERVAPLFPWKYYVAFNKSFAHFMAGRMDEGEDSLELQLARIAHGYPDSPMRSALLATVEEVWQATAAQRAASGSRTPRASIAEKRGLGTRGDRSQHWGRTAAAPAPRVVFGYFPFIAMARKWRALEDLASARCRRGRA